MSLHLEAQEWERLGDDVVVRLDSDFHRLIGEAAETWLRLAAGKTPKRKQLPLVSQLVALGVVREQ